MRACGSDHTVQFRVRKCRGPVCVCHGSFPSCIECMTGETSDDFADQRTRDTIQVKLDSPRLIESDLVITLS
jgi:hypothetical protein